MSGTRSGRSRSAPPSGMAGVTLMELLVTLSIAVIVMTVAVPGFSSLIAETRRVTAVNELVGALNMARSEAIKRGVRVTLCKTISGNADALDCDLSVSWDNDWLLFVDQAHLASNSRGSVDEGDEIIRIFNRPRLATITTGVGFAGAISYLPNGLSQGIRATGSAGVANGTFVFCTEEKNGYQVVINRTGRISVRDRDC